MAHKFDPKHLKKLDNPERRKILPPTETLQQLGFTQEDILADIGAGIGYFSIPAAAFVTTGTPIYALDTSQEMLTYLTESEMKINGKQRITTILTDEYDFKLPDASVTFALLVNVLHEIDDHHRFLSSISHITKPGGKLAIIEWIKKETESGPPLIHRLSAEETTFLLNMQGYTVISSHQFGDHFYGLVAQRDAL